MAQSKFDTAYKFQNISTDSCALRASYREQHWEPLWCSKLPTPVACVVFDTSVSVNSKEAISLLQRTLNAVGYAHLDEFTVIPENGEMSPQVLKLMNDLYKIDLEYYVARHMARTRTGCNRNLDLLNYIAQLEMELV